MKTIIAGSRYFHDYNLLKEAVNLFHFHTPITQVISGGARGADSMGEWWAKENNIPLVIFPAEWNKYGKAAGPVRNIEMAKNAEALIAFLAPNSRGTKHMIETAKKYNLIITVINI